MNGYPKKGEPSDYGNRDNWFLLPDAEGMTREVDLIYFYATIAEGSVDDGGSLQAICAIDDASLRRPDGINQTPAPNVFAPMCNVFVPWWRQVTSLALSAYSTPEVESLMHEEPRTDVFGALDYYFEHYNNGRPFVLAGHSQGAAMIYIVLADYMRAHPDRYARMIAAYCIGNGLTKDYLAANPHVNAAQCADDLGVCISWITEGPGNADYPNIVVKPGCVCINPLNWRIDDTPATPDQNIGCVVYDANSMKYVAVPEVVGARIDLTRGTVMVDAPERLAYTDAKAWGPYAEKLFGPDSYHCCDYGFFYYNIRENAKLRIRKWFATHR